MPSSGSRTSEFGGVQSSKSWDWDPVRVGACPHPSQFRIAAAHTTGEIGTLSSHVESVFSPVIQVTLWALPRATTGTVQNEDCWTRRFHLVSTLWLGFHSQSCLTMLTTCDSDLITPLLLSCIFTVHMNPPLLVCRSKEPLLETGFTLIGLSNQLRGSVTQRASIFFYLRTLTYGNCFEILQQNCIQRW